MSMLKQMIALFKTRPEYAIEIWHKGIMNNYDISSGWPLAHEAMIVMEQVLNEKE